MHPATNQSTTQDRGGKHHPRRPPSHGEFDGNLEANSSNALQSSEGLARNNSSSSSSTSSTPQAARDSKLGLVRMFLLFVVVVSTFSWSTYLLTTFILSPDGKRAEEMASPFIAATPNNVLAVTPVANGSTPGSDGSPSRVAITGGQEGGNLATTGGGFWNHTSMGAGEIAAGEEECPRCDAMFRKLERSPFGMRGQDVRMQIRGEPKSGTSFMFEWAVNALMVACSRLEHFYGENTCSVTWKKADTRTSRPKAVTRKSSTVDMKVVYLVFEPNKNRRIGAGAPACPCKDVKRVSVSISHLLKHNMPVSGKCAWQHFDGISREGAGCTTVAGQPVRNYGDVAACSRESPCTIVDDRVQMLVLRDPRAVVVSSYYYLKTHVQPNEKVKPGESVDDFALRMLPTICRFVHLRYLLLLEKMGDKTVNFWYDESLADPLEWHRRWLSSVGLSLPESIVREATDTAVTRAFGFETKGIDSHPGGAQAAPSRSYHDEIGPEVKAKLDDICRLWLPPVLLDKFGVPPS